MSVAFATEFGADGRCVRVASISSHGAVLTAHETGVLVLRSASDLSVVIARATVLDAHVLSEGTPAAPACIYDAAVSTDQQWCIASAGDGVVCKTARFALPSLSFLDNVASTALPARALAISPDNAVIAVGSDDHKLLLVRTTDITQCWSLFGAKASIKSVSIRLGLEPSQYLIGAASCDGNVRVWKVAGDGDGCIVSPLCCRECLGTERHVGMLGKPRHDVAWCPLPSTSPPRLAVPADNKVMFLCPSDSDMGRKAYLQAWKVAPATLDVVVVPLGTCAWSPDAHWLVTADTATTVSLWQLDAADNLYHMRKQGHLGAQVIQVSWCGAVAVLLSSSGSVAVCDLLSLPAAASTREPAVDSSLAQPPAAPRQDSHAIIDSDSDDVVARAGRAPVRRRTMVMSDEDDDADAAPAREATSVVSSERSLGSKPRHAHKAKQSAATKADVSAYFDDAAAHSSESDASESGADSDTEPQVKVGTSTASAGTGSVVRVPALASAVIPSPAAPARNRSSSVASAADDVEHSSGDADAPVVAASVPAQDAFQPGSTARPDLTDAGTHRHFLVWNRVGSIVCRLDTDSDGVPMNNIDIEFADASRMRNIKFTEQFDFCMAALGMSSAVFANKRVLKERRLRSLLEAEDAAALENEPTGKPATIVFRGFGGPLPTNWQESLPLDEDVMAVAVGSNWAAAVTSRQWLRVFQAGGSQGAIVCLPGPVVCMVGEGPLLGLVFHRSAPAGARQFMAVGIWRISADGSASNVTTVDLPLGEDAVLSWVGFSSNHIFTSLDSNGLLMGLLPGAAGCGMHWQPLLDTASHVIISKKELSAWAIGVDTDKLLCVLCKTSAPEPRTTPKPVQTTLVLSAPLLGRAAAPGRIEQEDAIALKRALLEHMQWCFDSRIDLFADDSPEKASGVGSLLSTGGAAFARAALERASTDMDKALLRQFQAACKEEKDFRAFDIVQRLRSPKSVDIAIKVAQQARRTALAQLLYNIRHTLVPAAASPQWQGPSAVEPVPSAHVAEVTPPDRAMVTAAPEPAVDSITAYLAKVPMRQLTREGSTKPTSLAGPTPQAAKAAAAVPSSSKTMASPSKPTPADGPKNPFAKAITASPSKRPRNLYDALAVTASPQLKKQTGTLGLQRQSTFAMEARSKRQDFLHKSE